MDIKFKPVAKSISANKGRAISTKIINQAILDDISNNQEVYVDITKINTSENGAVQSISSDMYKINRLKSRVNLIIQEKLSGSQNKQFSIPLGTLMGWELLNERGPNVPLGISSSGSVNSEIKSEFTSAGVNQTLHRIYINIHARITVVIPGSSSVTEADTDVLISETVIVGNVPQMCGGIQTYPGTVKNN